MLGINGRLGNVLGLWSTAAERNPGTAPITGLDELITAYKEVYRDGTGEDFPQDPYDQLEKSIEAVFKSWNIPRAVRYPRKSSWTGWSVRLWWCRARRDDAE